MVQTLSPFSERISFTVIMSVPPPEIRDQ